MSAYDRLRQQGQEQEQKAVSEQLSTLTSKVDADRRLLDALRTSVARLSEYLTTMDEDLGSRLDRLSTSLEREHASTPQDSAALSEQLSEIEQTLSSVAGQLNASELVQLPDGSRVTRRDLEAHAMMQHLSRQMTTTASASEALAAEVRERGNIHIDTDKLETRTLAQFDQRLGAAIEPRVQRLEQTMTGHEDRVEGLGAELAASTDRAADALEKTVRSSERCVQRLQSAVTWRAVGHMGLALIPLAVAIIVLGGLVGGLTQAIGLGPLFTWAWASFEAATVWSSKILIALATLVGAGVLVGVILGLAWWIRDKLGL